MNDAASLFFKYTLEPYRLATNVLLPWRNVESCTKLKPVMQSDSIITYGLFRKEIIFVTRRIECAFVNNSKLLTHDTWKVHWNIALGQITIEETIFLLHIGALWKGLQ